MRAVTYVAASDEREALTRFLARLTHGTEGEAQIRADELNADDRCDPPCTYGVYQASISIDQVYPRRSP